MKKNIGKIYSPFVKFAERAKLVVLYTFCPGILAEKDRARKFDSNVLMILL